ncbi:hypothetical protein [Pisciglobus halotolerans]|uniref:Uncharacterized protein n=1 Tax=Pisciglobus halotolerans TaxID=745365 RepID=A0A1I3AXI0_9LACT|nr:hypothetical protein [Pisciglobus halotolerans]SFH54429.1 hypothetical protein SAMN04489868_10268 [Pisciglobus halotolerans]
MRQHYDALKAKLQDTSKAESGKLVEEIKQAYEDGKIDKAEQQDLLQAAKGMLGSMELGNIKDAGFFDKR